MGGYNEKSCNALEKPFYRPVEAALRWCGLIEHEGEILGKLDSDGIPKTGQFPDWPCLQANTERILDAIVHGKIDHGRDGKTVGDGDHVAKPRVTVRHTDLREWMNKYHPGQKPPFLFDETERNTHTAINADTFRALQADRDAAKAEIEKLKALLVNAHEERDRLHGENKSLQAKTDKFLTQTERNSLLVIIAALCDYSAIMYEERGAAQRIMKMTDEIGAHLDDQTIRTALEKIPNAVESRGEIGMK